MTAVTTTTVTSQHFLDFFLVPATKKDSMLIKKLKILNFIINVLLNFNSCIVP